MRTPYNSSARRTSSWLMVVLGAVAYVGLLYGLTLLPLQFEVPLPSWGIAVAPPIVYGLLVLLLVHWPTPLGWLIGTAVLSGLHVLLTFARAPVSAFLDPTLAGRPLPWVVPPPLPELVGLILLLVPLRDLLRARPRSARERLAAARAAGVTRVRGAARPVQAVPSDDRIPAGEGATPSRVETPPEPPAPPAPAMPAAPVLPPATTTVSAVDTESGDEIRRRRAAARAERRREMEARRPAPRRSEAVLRIALDRVMDQLPPGTFLAPEDEVAASLRDPGHLLIPGDLVVTQLSEGLARVAWNDIVDQFPPHLIGLGLDEVTEHLGDGLRLPLDEVVGQLPHDLFVAGTPEIEVPGLDRIPVPFHPVEDVGLSTPPVPQAPPARPSLSDLEPPSVASATSGAAPLPPRPAPAPVAPEPPSYVDEPILPAPAARIIEAPAAAPIATAAPLVPPPTIESTVADASPVAEPASKPVPEFREATVRISLARVESEIPAEVFSQPLEQVWARMHAPAALLVPLSCVLPQLGEGVIRVGWDVVAPQFPHDLMTISDAEMATRLPHGLQLPLDEVIRQLSPELFASTGPAADVSGLESFPAPFQPLLSDPAPETRPAAPSPVAPSVRETVESTSPATSSSASPVEIASDPAAKPSVEQPSEASAVTELATVTEPPSPLASSTLQVSEPAPVAEPLAIESFVRLDYPEPATESASEVVRAVIPAEEPSPARAETNREIVAVPATPEPVVESEPVVLPVPVLTPEPVGTQPERVAAVVPDPIIARPEPPAPRPAAPCSDSEAASIVSSQPPAHSEPKHRWDDVVVGSDPSVLPHGVDPASSARLRQIVRLLAPIAPFEATVQSMEGVNVYALTAPGVSAEVAGAATGLALPLLIERRSPWPIDQLTLRGAETALVLTPLGPVRGPVLAAAAPRGGALALLEILSRRTVDGDRDASGSAVSSASRRPRTVVAAVSPVAAAQVSGFTAFGPVTASVVRDTEGETTFYFFLPSGVDVPAVGAFAQDLQAVMRKAAGSGAVFRSAVLRSGSTIVVIQPEEVGHGRSIVVVAGGDVTRPGLAYRQVERTIATLAQA